MSAPRVSLYARGVLERVRKATDGSSGIAYRMAPSPTFDALVRKGLIRHVAHAGGYMITDAGRIFLEPVIKECGCGKKYTKTSWKLLDFVSYYEDDAPAIHDHPEFGEPKGRCEMRNCVCGSTIVLPCSDLEKAPCT